MRWLALAGILALLVGYGDRIQSGYETWTGKKADPRVEAAIDLRCGDESVVLRTECARELRRDFQTGARHPEAIVRPHCTRFMNDWSLEIEQPSTICTELYGGWIEG